MGDQETPDMVSPFLPSTKIQFAWFQATAEWLVAGAYQVGECLECHLEPNEKGYSSVSFGRAIKWRAHRVIFFAKYPNEDQAKFVLHTCDNRRCINIDHLFLGTAQDNTDDMIAKGRKIDDPKVGERRRLATARLIAVLLSKGYDDERIASEYGISRSTIWNYRHGPYSSTLALFTGDKDNVCLG